MKNAQKFISLVVSATFLAAAINSYIGQPLISATIVSTLLGGIYWFWDNWGWQIPIFKNFVELVAGLNAYPDIRGEWVGHVKSSFDEYKTEYPITVTIEQTYSKIIVVLQAKQSGSVSYAAHLEKDINGKWFLMYAYTNTATDNELIKSVNGGMHRGFAYLELRNSELLKGEYYADNNRKNAGFMTIERKR